MRPALLSERPDGHLTRMLQNDSRAALILQMGGSLNNQNLWFVVQNENSLTVYAVRAGAIVFCECHKKFVKHM